VSLRWSSTSRPGANRTTLKRNPPAPGKVAATPGERPSQGSGTRDSEAHTSETKGPRSGAGPSLAKKDLPLASLPVTTRRTALLPAIFPWRPPSGPDSGPD
jgi:hypothetical protein